MIRRALKAVNAFSSNLNNPDFYNAYIEAVDVVADFNDKRVGELRALDPGELTTYEERDIAQIVRTMVESVPNVYNVIQTHGLPSDPYSNVADQITDRLAPIYETEYFKRSM